MRILHISTDYKPLAASIGHGGVERLLFELIKEQKRRGDQVSVLAMAGSDVGDSSLAEIGIVFPADIQSVKRRDPVEYERICNSIFSRVRDLATTAPFDVVHDHMGAFATSLHLHGVPSQTAVVVSCYGLQNHPHYHSIYKKIPAAVSSRQSLYVTVCSDDHRKHFANLFAADRVVYHGVPSGTASLRPANGYHLCMANVTPDKGQDEILNVSLKTGIPVVFAGPLSSDTPEFRQYSDSFAERVEAYSIDRVHELNVESAMARVDRAHGANFYVGEVSAPEDREQLFRHASRLILCNRSPEPFSLVILEALVRGLPVVAGPFRSIREVDVPGVTTLQRLEAGEIAKSLSQPMPPVRDVATAALAKYSTSRWADDWSDAYADALARVCSLP